MLLAHSQRRFMPTLALVAVILALIALVIGAARSVGAQDAAGEPHPAHIHEGTCETLGGVVHPLEDVTADMVVDGAPVDGELMGPDSAIPVWSSVTTVEAPLSDILAAEHAVNVHESADDMGTYIACGTIGGMVFNDTLLIGLGELNDSGHTGVAILEGDGDQTTVTVYLVEPTDVDPAMHIHDDADEADDAVDEEAVTDAVEVDMVDNAFDPVALEIEVGTTVTWTNLGELPHTATESADRLFQSGTLSPGDSFSFTFDEPGTYEYFCEFHPGMEATIIVS